jgi:excisionase family DNA binding protein
MTERLLTPAELAERLQIPVKTLYAWRYHRQGPPAYRIGRHVRYSWPAVVRWMDERNGERP